MEATIKDCVITVVPGRPGARWARVLLWDAAGGDCLHAYAYPDAELPATGRGAATVRLWTGARGTRARVTAFEPAAQEASRPGRARAS